MEMNKKAVENIFDYGSYGHVSYNNLKRAKNDLNGNEYTACGENCQQCIEKILKEYLQRKCIGENIRDFLSSHNLKKLLAKSQLEVTKEIKSTIHAISSYYYETRYPGVDYYELTEEDANDAYETALILFNQICYVELPKLQDEKEQLEQLEIAEIAEKDKN